MCYHHIIYFHYADIATFQKCKHQDDVMLLCVTCCMYVCYECAFLEHADHEVFAEEEFGNGIEVYQKTVQDDLKMVHEMIQAFEMKINAQRTGIRIEKMKQEVESFARKFYNNMKSQRQVSEVKLSTLETSMCDAFTKKKKEVESLQSLSRNILDKRKSTNSSDNLVYLQNINNLKAEIAEGIKQAEDIIAAIKETVGCVKFLPSSLSAKFVTVTFGQIVGAIRINKSEVVIVTDQRHQDPPAIRLSCVSCENTAQLCWSHVIESEYLRGGDKLPSIAVCNNLFILPSTIFILIGCGTRLFQVKISEPKDSCFYVSLLFKDLVLPEGAEITCVNVLLSSEYPVGVMITDSVSHSITKLNRDLELLEKLELTERPHLATGVFNKEFTYAYSDGKSVKVINGRSPTHVSQIMESPKSDQVLSPASMFHDFAAFSVLWRKEEKKETWQYQNESKVAVYNSKGDMKKVSHEQNDTDSYAVGISFIKNNGLLCLANGKVELYDTL